MNQPPTWYARACGACQAGVKHAHSSLFVMLWMARSARAETA